MNPVVMILWLSNLCWMIFGDFCFDYPFPFSIILLVNSVICLLLGFAYKSQYRYTKTALVILGLSMVLWQITAITIITLPENHQCFVALLNPTFVNIIMELQILVNIMFGICMPCFYRPIRVEDEHQVLIKIEDPPPPYASRESADSQGS